ncbi:energy transducer TonB [Chryseobacterium sp. Ch-15]|uniref:Energy transducer TonB n=1 Tax=Chryseobacterium muglaense TaxID=2893752 RepID=A0A9Q3USY5_9FLAO|nr:energy transducer TonB [Chryseobacterium muglaense]MBD3905968.1 energy transducer TonB [Chryseobacterium muglaense]MCC9035053.1 energy transducer TonB [Chryseobacterium muglaense]MCM2555766.1 energy transducer TonB [Chryseobacterium muglaense]
MKKYFFVLILLIGFKSFAQESQVESENLPRTEKAEFPGGDEVFTKEFLKIIHGYIDLSKYAVNGQFTFLFDVTTDGKVDNLKVLPKVKDSELFIDDMNFAIKNVKKKWKPAIQDGKPVVSKKVIKINFTSDHFDHGD